MNFGISGYVCQETNTPGERAISPQELGPALEQRGFDSFFIAEHTHVPQDIVVWPGEGAGRPRYHRYMYDPFVALTVIATLTRRLRIGTGMSLVSYHDPIVLAKQVATLDQLSGGRFDFGVGAGWDPAQAPNHGIAEPRQRYRMLTEFVRAMKEIWTSEPAEFQGEFVSFKPLYSRPWPVRDGGPPVIIGGWSEGALRRAVEIADEWMAPPMWEVKQVAELLPRLRRLADEAGRPTPRISLFLRSGTPDEVERALALEPARLLFFLEPENRSDSLRRFDGWQRVIERHR